MTNNKRLNQININNILRPTTKKSRIVLEPFYLG